MQINSESCVYVEGDDVVYGVQDLNDTSLFDEYSYYGAPQSPTFSGGYLFDNQEHSYDYGAYPYENYPVYYLFDNQEHSYDYGAYPYENYPVYYLYPTYPGYYALTSPQYSPEILYNVYYVYVPVNIYYYVPDFAYYLPTSTNNVNDVIYDVDSSESYESDVLSSPREQSFEDSQEFDSKFYNIGNISSTKTYDICNEIVGEGITTCYLFYDEYPETLNDAPVDDEAKSVPSNEEQENNVVSNEAEVNTNITVNEESYSIETNHCEDDVDRNVIKKISSMSIDDVKEDIDVNYENAKAFVYNEVLKGYTEIKNQLEELDWECHSLEDILEEEEPESDSSETDFNENVAEVLENINLLPDEDEESYFESVAFSEKCYIQMRKDLVEDHRTMMIEAKSSVDPSVVEEKDETDPVLELSSSKENLCSGSLNAIKKHNPAVDPSLVEENDETDPVLELSSSKENICSGSLNAIKEHNPAVDPSLVEENDETDPVLELSSSKEKLCSGSLNAIKEHNPAVDPSLVEENDETDPVLELSSSKENICSGSLNAIEEHNPPVDPSAVEEKEKIGPFLEQALSKEELYAESLNTFEEHCMSGNKSVEEKDKLDSVPELSLREEKFDSRSRSNIEDLHTNMPSQDRGEERLKSDPDIIAPAASKEVQRKKRFSGLRKFLARMCCCAKKRS